MTPIRFLLAIENQDYCALASAFFKEKGARVDLLPKPESMPDADLTGALLILDTDDDIPKMNQIVHSTYDKQWRGGGLPLFLIVAPDLLGEELFNFRWYRGWPMIISTMPRHEWSLKRLLDVYETVELL